MGIGLGSWIWDGDYLCLCASAKGLEEGLIGVYDTVYKVG